MPDHQNEVEKFLRFKRQRFEVFNQPLNPPVNVFQDKKAITQTLEWSKTKHEFYTFMNSLVNKPRIEQMAELVELALMLKMRIHLFPNGVLRSIEPHGG